MVLIVGFLSCNGRKNIFEEGFCKFIKKKGENINSKNQNNIKQTERMSKKTEVQINYAPSDVISALSFAPQSSQFLATSSWDGSVRLYDVVANNMRQKYLHNSPVLDVCFQVSFCKYFFFPVCLFLLKLSGLGSCDIWFDWRTTEALRSQQQRWNHHRFSRQQHQVCRVFDQNQRSCHGKLGQGKDPADKIKSCSLILMILLRLSSFGILARRTVSEHTSRTMRKFTRWALLMKN